LVFDAGFTVGWLGMVVVQFISEFIYNVGRPRKVGVKLFCSSVTLGSMLGLEVQRKLAMISPTIGTIHCFGHSHISLVLGAGYDVV